MTQFILHHYDLSPYAEKIRLALGLKGLAWHAVDTPMVVPKPDHFELTGGYRRVPVLQVGADVYIDSHAIARALDRFSPSPALYPPGQETLAHALSQWGETSFMMVIMAYFGIGGIFPEDFVEDRVANMMPPGTNIDAAPKALPTKLLQLRSNVLRLEDMLDDGRAFLMGDAPCVADLSAYHPLMMTGMHQKTARLLAGADRVGDWMKRVAGIGHGERTEMSAADALQIAAEAEPAPYEGEPVLPDGMAIGTPVIAVHDDYGSGNVTGTLAASGPHEIAIRRQGERIGEVVVHFPRETWTVIALG